jgi:methionyl-tRNA formyltransferase
MRARTPALPAGPSDLFEMTMSDATSSAPFRLVVMGTGTFAEPTLDAFLNGPDQVVGAFTQPDREGVVKRGSTRQVGRGIKEIAAEKGVPVFQPADVNTPEGVEQLRSLNPDVLIVAAYGQILSKEVLSIPRVGAFNVHGSLLPKYRGAAPIAHAILQGESETGVTIIRMSIGLDAGEMLAKAALPIGTETAGEMEAKLAPIGAQLALQTIARLHQGPISGEAQNKALVTKAPKLRKEDGLINWSQPAEQVCRQIRAMQPWPTSYSYFHRSGKPPARFLIATVQISSEPNWGEPGSCKMTADRRLLIQTQLGVVEALELQPAGKKRMPASEFLRGHPILEGDRFGSENP